jgi:pimeloyl-ACP methyl ester carboxylesterase
MFATAKDGTRLYYEEAGTGTPILFIHEFGGNFDAWEPQMSFFARRHRCITYAARGYTPSDIPAAMDSYSQALAVSDAATVLDAAGVEKAHIVGLSMGGFTTVHFGLDFADRALSLTIASAGYGCEKAAEEYFRCVSLTVADRFEADPVTFAETYGRGASRVQFETKDPRGHAAFVSRLARHDPVGTPNTMRGVQARRPSFWDLEDRLKACELPAIIMVGDEDDHCLQPGIYLKRMLPASGLVVFPKTGHTLNLEEPALFNTWLAEFIAMVEAGAWRKRDTRADSGQVMRTD